MAVIDTMLAEKAGELDCGVKVSPFAGEEVVGDAFVAKRFGERWLLAVIDGLGHGQEAFHAAQIAKQVIKESNQPHLSTILSDCHVAMKNTRGAVIGLVFIDYGQNRLTWVGTGNAGGKIVWRGDRGRLEQSTLMSMPGIVGFNLPKPNQQVYNMKPGTLIIMFTDGISDRWVFPEGNWLFEMETEALAARLMKSYGKDTDDSLIAVVRYPNGDQRPLRNTEQ